MQFTLIRQPPVGLAVRGTLFLSSSNASKTTEQGQSPIGSFKGVPTLENAAYLIPCGMYPLTVTYSPKFKRMLPLVCDVPYEGSGPSTPRPIRERPGEGLYRSGIRFHPGTKPEHSRGCILVSRSDESLLRDLIQKESCTLTVRNVGD